MKRSIFSKQCDDDHNKINDIGMNMNMNMNMNTNNNNIILDRNYLLSTIPDEATEVMRNQLPNEVMWRWRFFEVSGRRMIEISYAEPDQPRIYIDYEGNNTHYKMDMSWDQYVTKVLYYYAPFTPLKI